jgi:hypothetical protein
VGGERGSKLSLFQHLILPNNGQAQGCLCSSRSRIQLEGPTSCAYPYSMPSSSGRAHSLLITSRPSNPLPLSLLKSRTSTSASVDTRVSVRTRRAHQNGPSRARGRNGRTKRRWTGLLGGTRRLRETRSSYRWRRSWRGAVERGSRSAFSPFSRFLRILELIPPFPPAGPVNISVRFFSLPPTTSADSFFRSYGL